MRAVYSASPISVGQSVSAELPNITGKITSWTPEGAFAFSYVAITEGFYSGGLWAGTSKGLVNIDASRCSSIYKDSATTVVPESLITNFYIKY